VGTPGRRTGLGVANRRSSLHTVHGPGQGELDGTYDRRSLILRSPHKGGPSTREDRQAGHFPLRGLRTPSGHTHSGLRSSPPGHFVPPTGGLASGTRRALPWVVDLIGAPSREEPWRQAAAWRTVRRVFDNGVIEEAGRRLMKATPPQSRVILFGSAARGELTRDSDLDFLIVERDVKNRHAEQVRLRRELRGLGVPVDIIVVSERYAEEWGPAKGSMVHAALIEGRALHDAA